MNNAENSVRKNSLFTLKGFINDSRSVGILLLLCTAISIIITNLPGIGVKYNAFWDAGIPFLSSFNFPHSTLHIINDLLMAVFFFQVGMEIKREAVSGELSSPKRMMLPLVAALSGVLVPAIIFIALTNGTEFTNGWAIPTATDIAFSLGILSLLGKAIPHSFKVFLTALAIIDDLCAILIIAFFYGSDITFMWLGGVALCILLILMIFKVIKNKKVSNTLYILIGMFMWYCMYRSGIHSTFAGVLLAMLLPISRIHSFEEKLLVPVNFFIIPLFALANTSIFINATAIANLLSPLSLGIILGLFIGKPVGISTAVFILSKLKFVHLKTKSEWNKFIGVSILAGIGFTMSIFVSSLAFGDNKMAEDTAKLAVLLASFLAMTVGYFWLRMATKDSKEADSEAERLD